MRGARVREVACVGAPRTMLAVDLGDPQLPLVSLSAGVHGDEPAAPWALLTIVRDGLLDPRFGYRIWPCLNPTGYAGGTRENAEGADVNRSFSRGGTTPEARTVFTANRDRRFVLALDLHEDFEAEGCYVYEPLRRGFASFYAGRGGARARRRRAAGPGAARRASTWARRPGRPPRRCTGWRAAWCWSTTRPSWTPSPACPARWR